MVIKMKQTAGKQKRYLAFVLILALSFLTLAGSAGGIPAALQQKADSALRTAVRGAEANELLSVCIFLKNLDAEAVGEALLEETGMDPAVFENYEKFEVEYRAELKEALVQEVGEAQALALVPDAEIPAPLQSAEITPVPVNGGRPVYP